MFQLAVDVEPILKRSHDHKYAQSYTLKLHEYGLIRNQKYDFLAKYRSPTDWFIRAFEPTARSTLITTRSQTAVVTVHIP
jgi:hypothetical protein